MRQGLQIMSVSIVLLLLLRCFLIGSALTEDICTFGLNVGAPRWRPRTRQRSRRKPRRSFCEFDEQDRTCFESMWNVNVRPPRLKHGTFGPGLTGFTDALIFKPTTVWHQICFHSTRPASHPLVLQPIGAQIPRSLLKRTFWSSGFGRFLPVWSRCEWTRASASPEVTNRHGQGCLTHYFHLHLHLDGRCFWTLQ